MKMALAGVLAGVLLNFSLSAALGASPTFHSAIAPVIYRACSPCHHAGGPGPFPLVSYRDVKAHARQIADVVRRRYMPPWLPEHGYGDFAEERRLNDEQVRLIEDWVKAGSPEGDRSAGPRPPRFSTGWELGTPDLLIRASQPYLVPPSGPDVFWNFIFSPSIGRTRYVKAVEIQPGNARLVHHANLLIDRNRSARVNEKEPGAGFPGMDLSIESTVADPESHFLFWKPGSVPYEQPQGLSWRLDPGNDLVLNVHLRPSGRPEPVQPSIGLYFTDVPPDRFPILIQLEHDGALNIPAGAPDFLVGDDFTLPLDVNVLAVYPHAHYLGKLLEGYATLPGGERKWLVRVPQWDLNWQAVYRYREPVFLPKGTVVSMRYHYDNSASNPRNPNRPPKEVHGGNQSTDEMGHLWLQVLPVGTKDRRMMLEEAMFRRRLQKYPADFSAHFNLGGLLLSRKDAAAAIPYLRDAVRIAPDQPAARNTLGAALESEGKWDEAITQFRAALHAQPRYWNARYNLANALARQGSIDEAIEEFRQVAEANPGDAAAREHFMEALRESGDACVSRGDFAKAAGRYADLAKLKPGDADLRNSLGTLYARAGDFPRAIEAFRAALAIDPSHQGARRNLEMARQMAH